jgi:hypothetical protein
MAVKDFNLDCGDPAYTIGIVDLLLECIELSHRPGKYLLVLSLCLHSNISAECNLIFYMHITLYSDFTCSLIVHIYYSSYIFSL